MGLAEYILENIDSVVDRVGAKVVKWALIYSVARLLIGMGMISFMMGIAYLVVTRLW